MKHTPEPWESTTNGITASEFKVEGFSKPYLCTFMHNCHPQTEANRKLLVASPKMLTALLKAEQGLLAALPHADRIRDILHPILAEVRLAVAEATD